MANEKKNIYDVFIELIRRIDFSRLHGMEIANIIGSALVLLYIIFTAIQPLLYQINSLLITLGKILLNRDVSANNANATKNDVLLNLILLIVEIIICVIFCFAAEIINGNREEKKSTKDAEIEVENKGNKQ